MEKTKTKLNSEVRETKLAQNICLQDFQ